MNIRNHGHFPWNSFAHPCRLYNRCDGTCFQRSTIIFREYIVFYRLWIILGFYSSCSHGRMPHTIVQPCGIPSPCHPVIHCPFHHSCQPETIRIKEKPLDPSSYWVTVRRITPLHVAMAATEAYQTQKSRDSARTSPTPPDPTMISSSQKFRNNETTHLHEKDHAISKDQSSPSVPTKKFVKKNNGIQASSTSFVTTSAEQVRDERYKPIF